MARGLKDITAERRAELNAGAPARDLTECLAVDFATLMRKAVPAADANAMEQAADQGISKRMSLAGHFLLSSLSDLS